MAMALASVCTHPQQVLSVVAECQRSLAAVKSHASNALCLSNCNFTKLASTSCKRASSSISFPRQAARRTVKCEIAVELGGAPASEQKASIGDRIKVTAPLIVYHLLKAPNFQLKGCEGEVKDVLGTWKGKPVSANLPYKVQFVTEVNGQELKFFAHLKDDEFDVIQ